MNPHDFDTAHKPTWCPGCGDFGIWMSLKNALAKLELTGDDLFIVYGVGCHANMVNWMKTYGLAGLHGRSLPVAQGVKMANHKLPVIAVSGDGDCLGEGGNHLIHTAKRNTDITVIIHDNQVYGLTTGQASPTARPGLKTKSTPAGAVDAPISPLALAITAGATFVSRGFAGDAKSLTDLIIKAVNHKGFSMVDVLQPCVSFNKGFDYAWYREHIYDINSEGFKPDNKVKAFEKALEWGDKVPIGIFYEETRPANEDHESALSEKTLVDHPLGVKDVDSLLSEFI
ncbi:thiamine pyrophosphate-dependent enzyme [Patescibacteria group bacterium]